MWRYVSQFCIVYHRAQTIDASSCHSFKHEKHAAFFFLPFLPLVAIYQSYLGRPLWVITMEAVDVHEQLNMDSYNDLLFVP